MRQEIKNHLIYYTFLVLCYAGITAGVYFINDRKTQILLAAMGVFTYVFFGIIHHRENHDLHLKIVIEYILFGALGLSILFFLLKGGIGL